MLVNNQVFKIRTMSFFNCPIRWNHSFVKEPNLTIISLGNSSIVYSSLIYKMKSIIFTPVKYLRYWPRHFSTALLLRLHSSSDHNSTRSLFSSVYKTKLIATSNLLPVAIPLQFPDPLDSSARRCMHIPQFSFVFLLAAPFPLLSRSSGACIRCPSSVFPWWVWTGMRACVRA